MPITAHNVSCLLEEEGMTNYESFNQISIRNEKNYFH